MAASKIVAIVLASLVAVIVLFVGGLFVVGELLFGSPLEASADRRDFPEAHRFDEHLAKELATRWKAGQPFALSEIAQRPMARTCLGDWRRGGTPAHELARRSERPWWWRGHEGHSTLAIERPGGGVTAHLIKAYGTQIFGDRAVIRFNYVGGRGHVCARQGGLTFKPLPYRWAFLFEVAGD